MIEPPNQVRTKRLALRRPVLEDAEAIFEEYAADPEVTRYLTWVPHSERSTVVEFLASAIDGNASGKSYSWILSKPDEGTAIGMLGARVLGHMLDIGYVLGRRHWGNGYMPEAISWLAEWALQQAGVFRVSAVCDIENIASARALEKSNFEREGVLHRWIVLPNRSSEPRDCYIYGRAR